MRFRGKPSPTRSLEVKTMTRDQELLLSAFYEVGLRLQRVVGNTAFHR